LKADVFITLKPGVLDPQGEMIKRALQIKGSTSVEEVRVGKYIQIEIKGTDSDVIRKELEAISKQLLANPAIEDYRVELVEGV
jgi:phosphoribosylformylglycinamidine synthase